MKRYLIHTLICVVAMFCSASCGAQGERVSITTESIIVDPANDTVNRIARDDLTEVLAVTLDISPDDVVLRSAKVMQVPKAYLKTPTPLDPIEIRAIDEQQRTVGLVLATDTRVAIQEGVGKVVLEERTVSVAVPLIKRPERLTVAMPDRQALRPAEFDVAEISKAYCEKNPEAEICIARNLEDRPEFKLWNGTETEATASHPAQ